jgi:hypothetical protein
MAARTPDELPAELVLDDGARYPAIWLRDNCTCAGCVVPGSAGSGQKLFGITDLPPDLRIESADREAGTVRVVFAPDGHQARYDLAWLAARRPGLAVPPDDRAEDSKRLWEAADQADRLLPVGTAHARVCAAARGTRGRSRRAGRGPVIRLRARDQLR